MPSFYTTQSAKTNQKKEHMISKANDGMILDYLKQRNEILNRYNRLINGENLDWRLLNSLIEKARLLDETIDAYIRGDASETLFPVICTERELVAPQEECRLRTIADEFDLTKSQIIFDGIFPSEGHLLLTCERTKKQTDFSVKNDVPQYGRTQATNLHYGVPKVKETSSGTYEFQKGAIIAVGISKQKNLVKAIKKRFY